MLIPEFITGIPCSMLRPKASQRLPSLHGSSTACYSLSTPCFPLFNSMQSWPKPCFIGNSMQYMELIMLTQQCQISKPDFKVYSKIQKKVKSWGDMKRFFIINLKTLRGKVLRETHWPCETIMDYTKCMKLTKKHGIVAENMNSPGCSGL